MKRKTWIITSFVVMAVLGVLAALNRQGMLTLSSWGSKDCVPFNTRMNEEGKLTISWRTKSKCPGIVRFGSDLEDLQYWTNASLVDGRYTASLDTSKYQDVRYIVIISDGVTYGIEGKAIKVN